MMSRSFCKGALVGIGCVLVGAVSTVALAGSGIGAVFNLGQTNTVNAQSLLNGNTAGTAELRVNNMSASASSVGVLALNASNSAAVMGENSSSGIGVSALAMTGTAVYAQSGGAAVPALVAKNTAGGPAASFGVTAGVAPFKVNSSTKVANLNADQVDGFDVSQIMTGGGRIGQASNADVFTFVAPATQATTSLTAPSNGFVLVQGTVIAEDDFALAACNTCRIDLRLHDVGANVDSPVALTTLGNGTPGSFVTIPVEWVFPVTPGGHQYTLTAAQFDRAGGPALFDNAVLTAEFIPFGHAGSSTTLADNDSDNRIATPTETGKDGVRRSAP
jgi:hypothetical protein